VTVDDDRTSGKVENDDDVGSQPTLEDTLRSAPTEDLKPEMLQRPANSPQKMSGRLAPGEVFDETYRILEIVGHGGFCHVYRAKDLSSGNIVALKFLRDIDASTTVQPRMQREMRLARDLGHPNIVKVYELIERDDQLCLVMEFVDGATLKRTIDDDGGMSIADSLSILVDLASAVAAVHASGIVHRDLKPQNVMVSKTGEVKLLDFGLARTTDSTGLTATGTILGTPDYMSPEQVNGDPADSRSDVYSLGIIAWELLVGEPPFSGDTPIAVALQHVRSRTPDVRMRREDVPQAVSDLIYRMTEPEPAKRPRSAEAVLLELERSSVSGIDQLQKRSSWATSRWRVAAAAAIILLGGAVAGIKLLDSSPPEDFFADGRIVAAVQTRSSPFEVQLEQDLFLEDIADAIPKFFTEQRISHRVIEENLLSDMNTARSLGIEHLLEVSFHSDSEDVRGGQRLRLRVFSTSDGSLWWESSVDEEIALDYTQMVGVSRRLAENYDEQVRLAVLNFENQLNKTNS
jgi:serine/threonine protein kinase